MTSCQIFPSFWRAAFALALICSRGGASADEASAPSVARVAVYDVAPYGSRGPDGLFAGASVDLWRRAAEDLHWRYELTLVSRMDDVLSGIEHGQFDVAIGAISITPERAARVDFSYPAHRSGVAVAFARRVGALAAFSAYFGAASELGPLFALALALLLGIGVLMWWLERPRPDVEHAGESAVRSLHDGVYWAAVTMSTVGYGDKTPKTALGRFVAVSWMLGSLGLVSVMTTALVARVTADHVADSAPVGDVDLAGLRLTAVSDSSGAEYLDRLRLAYAPASDLGQALRRVAEGKSDAAVNSVGALRFVIARDFVGSVAPPSGVLAPAYMAFALAPNSPLRKPLDAALIRVTASPEWRRIEDGYFGR